MNKRVRSISFCLTKPVENMLNELCKEYEESRSHVIRRAIETLHVKVFEKEKKD